MKKIIAILVSVVLLVVFIGIFVGGFTHNLKKIMPKYETVIYSESNFLPYNKNLLDSAKKELDYKCNKIKNKNYRDGDYYKRGLREILRINKTNLDRFLEKYSEEKTKKYNELPIVEYKDIIDKYGYDDINKKTKLDLYLNFNEVREEELYYEIEGFLYLPSENRELINYIATKSNIENGVQKFKILKDTEICIAQGSNFLFASNIAYIDRTNGTSFEKRVKIKDFLSGASNLNSINFIEFDSMDQDNNDINHRGEAMRAQEIQVEENNNDINRRGEALRAQSQEPIDSEERQLTEQEIEELFFMLTTMHMNYVTYDKKGYICDLYYFEKSN